MLEPQVAARLYHCQPDGFDRADVPPPAESTRRTGWLRTARVAGSTRCHAAAHLRKAVMVMLIVRVRVRVRVLGLGC